MNIEVDQQIMSCVPRRLGPWRADESGKVVVERPKPGNRGLRVVIDNLRWLMSHPKIRLDELGSFVWQRLDGESTLAEIAEATAAAFPDRADGIDERLALFATALQHQGLIELRVPTG
ncbi:MAG: PqqD family peptide modification chaperone [Thermoanaerobaculales bacterium]|nr:PqqD family peptide modification chaperone [Thermoanaerobaculales bacterium]